VLVGAADCTGALPGEGRLRSGRGGRARASAARLEGAGDAAGVGIGHLRDGKEMGGLDPGREEGLLLEDKLAQYRSRSFSLPTQTSANDNK
jgi:hypothetical protein